MKPADIVNHFACFLYAQRQQSLAGEKSDERIEGGDSK
jgi:hypothetical protein